MDVNQDYAGTYRDFKHSTSLFSKTKDLQKTPQENGGFFCIRYFSKTKSKPGKKYRVMFFYLIENHMQKFRHFWRKKKLDTKLSLSMVLHSPLQLLSPEKYLNQFDRKFTCKLYIFTRNSWRSWGRISLCLSLTDGLLVDAVWTFLCAAAADAGGACCKGLPCSEVWAVNSLCWLIDVMETGFSDACVTGNIKLIFWYNYH